VQYFLDDLSNIILENTKLNNTTQKQKNYD
jgi:hypothetical protein